MNAEQIAKLAGVSRSTVSRVINNYPNVPPETREKVMRVINEHNYVPNVSAQVLAGKKTRTIGLFMIEKSGRVAGDILTNMLIASVIEEASSHNYFVLTYIIRGAGSEESVKNVTDMFYQRRVEGGLFIGAASREPFIWQLADEGFEVAIVDQRLSEAGESNRIVAEFDNEKGMSLAVRYLASLGHTEIGVINGDMSRLSGVTKYEGFLHAMEKCSLRVRPEWIVQADFNEEAGYREIGRLADSGTPLPTAFIAANDSVAFGAIRALNERGLQVPGDISIVGFDNHGLSARFNPSLTTVGVKFESMMKRLTASLIGSIEGTYDGSRVIVIDCELIVRDSCSPPKS
ncbi:LacI family DNA-binding transcriptional regulator [Paenibacillus humicola]|uniref:LacI family DNA-binding transcriptional regulator n=1 Tax=Paenibacillus humicola TaxID=3110540 RepID=UPI00237A879A|nr:LacI family DNA-binding transcriptional regulator [Paenibacillus humicola]